MTAILKIMPGKNHCYPFLLLGLLIFILYGNTLTAEWQFDDKPNILHNIPIHLDHLSLDSIRQTFYSTPGRGEMYRPVANLSFGLNWYLGQDNPFGYHMVNTVVHIFTAYFLYLVTLLLLQAPNATGLYRKNDLYFIGLLSTVLWAANPIQTQAVTYIVQRMASLAALFYILGIYFYLRARFSAYFTRQTLFFGGCLLSFALAVLSKENAAMLPASLVLIEIVFFQNIKTLTTFFIKHWKPLGVFSIVIVAAGIAYILKIQYEGRPYTMAERLLTEPRILIFHLSQMFYPLPDRFSIAHDIVVSKSLFRPWTTLPAILAIALMVGLATLQTWKRPLFALAVLFFFLNHLIESTFIPLELIFEHRNYLPSFFIFLPVAAGIRGLMVRYENHNKIIYILLGTMVGATIVAFGSFTYQRNSIWKTERSLWQDALKKAPMDARPYCNLAIQLAWGKDAATLQDYDIALNLFHRAMNLTTARTFLKQEIVANIGNIHFEKGEFREALPYYYQALEMNPVFLKARYNLIGALVMLGRWEEASRQADTLIDNPKGFVKPDYFNRKGFILLWQNMPETALLQFEKALELGPQNPGAVWLNAGVASSRLGRYQQAATMFQNAAKTSAADIRLYFASIENSVRSENEAATKAHLERLFATFDLQTIVHSLDSLSENFRTAPMVAELIRPVVAQKLMQLSMDIESLD